MAVREILDEASARTSGQLSLVLVGLLLFSYLAWSLTSYRRLSHIPGPPVAAWTSWWWFFKSLGAQGHTVLADVSIRYGKKSVPQSWPNLLSLATGSFARIMPNTVVTDDMDLYRKMNAIKGSSYTKAAWYAAFKLDAERENLFTERNEERHTRVRQQLSPGYSGKDNRNLESSVDELMMETVLLIQRKYLSYGSEFRRMDFAAIAQQLTLDVITYLALGKPFGYIAEDTDKYDYIKSIEDNFPIMNAFATVPLLSDVMRIPAIQNTLIPSASDKVGLGKAKA